MLCRDGGSFLVMGSGAKGGACPGSWFGDSKAGTVNAPGGSFFTLMVFRMLWLFGGAFTVASAQG